ncbi:MAG TPA: type I restriction endonuclease subunit R [Myxococcota bacterium]|nr:type I restriction endonuclease subunit R [Myxococcota bacterium]HOH77214.1 type I restriction endonuclease subunit R [Myxococcota bacterium]
MGGFLESDVEEAALDWLGGVGWTVLNGAEHVPGLAAPDGGAPLRETYDQVVLGGRLRDALARLNPGLAHEALQQAFRRLTHPEGSDTVRRNRAVHRMLVDGVTVEYRAADGNIRGAQVRVIDFDNPENNDLLAINQFTIVENHHKRRPDIILFVNGLPVVVIELKNAVDATATVWNAFAQLQTYRTELTGLFAFNELIVASDGVSARLGTLTANREWMKPWPTIDGRNLADTGIPELQVSVLGILQPRRLLDMIRDFIVFEDDGGSLVKKMAGYHQYHAVLAAVGETIRASLTMPVGVADGGDGTGRYQTFGGVEGGRPGDRRIGVVWHTQGSGKSLTMAFYAGRIIREPAMENPTVVVLTDRNDLDDQLFGTFAKCRELLRQPPVQAESREHMRSLLNVASGGVVFTTIQKFLAGQGEAHPMLSERRNIVVIADEAHRSQYDFVDGLARNLRDALPKASFIGFTGTPIELADANTRGVFGAYISIYDIQRAVADGATVPIYYESRLAKLALDPAEMPVIDTGFEEATEGEEVERKERLKSRWAQLEAIVGAERRLNLVADDILTHMDARAQVVDGKVMIVCMSRRICVEMYRALIERRPEWAGDGDEQGAVKVIMTGSAVDPVDWRQHIRSKDRREKLAERFRRPDDHFRIVIVRDMWLTGFDAPCLQTMYIDKPMRGHGLMQAIARVNRVFRDKPGGLVVDYIGLAQELKSALATYTESGGQGRAALDVDDAVAAMLEKYEVCQGLFGSYVDHGKFVPGFDWSEYKWTDRKRFMKLLLAAKDHVLGQERGSERLKKAVAELNKAHSLIPTHPQAMRIADHLAFFQDVRSVLDKLKNLDSKSDEELDHAVRQIISRAVTPEGVMDVFAAVGLDKPDISILSDEFLMEVKDIPYKNVAVELLQKLLMGEIRTRRTRNAVQSRAFSEMLEQSLRRYQNRAIETAQVIEELIALAKEMRAADARGEALGLTQDELAFYDALETNDSAVKVLGDETLRTIARELVTTVRANVTIDWTIRENVRAHLRTIVKRVLRRYGYPPDKQEQATRTVLEQAELLCNEWAA